MANDEEFSEAEINLKNAIARYYKACQGQELDDEKFCVYLGDAVKETTETDGNPDGVVLGDYII